VVEDLLAANPTFMLLEIDQGAPRYRLETYLISPVIWFFAPLGSLGEDCLSP
jgi:hypothetical protein